MKSVRVAGGKFSRKGAEALRTDAKSVCTLRRHRYWFRTGRRSAGERIRKRRLEDRAGRARVYRRDLRQLWMHADQDNVQ